jgi:hypothetical protein
MGFVEGVLGRDLVEEKLSIIDQKVDAMGDCT